MMDSKYTRLLSKEEVMTHTAQVITSGHFQNEPQVRSIILCDYINVGKGYI